MITHSPTHTQTHTQMHAQRTSIAKAEMNKANLSQAQVFLGYQSLFLSLLFSNTHTRLLTYTLTSCSLGLDYALFSLTL